MPTDFISREIDEQHRALNGNLHMEIAYLRKRNIVLLEANIALRQDLYIRDSEQPGDIA